MWTWSTCNRFCCKLFCTLYQRITPHNSNPLTDNKPCVQAYDKLCKGQFSASPRLSTFLSSLSGYNLVLNDLKGEANISSDYNSRNPRMCKDASCQVCKFVEEAQGSVISSVTVSDVLSGVAKMPFLNNSAWQVAQQDSPPRNHGMLKIFDVICRLFR